MALSAAREIADREGLRGLSVRRIASEIGYSGGTLYNLFENLDDLVVHVNARTLDRLYDELSRESSEEDPEAAVLALTIRYVCFTRDHPRLWSMLFEHRLPEGQGLPDWYYDRVDRARGLLEKALEPLFGPGRDAEVSHSARVLWSSLHGICSLEMAGKLAITESVEAMSRSLVSNYLAGLRQTNSSYA
jgi:AcrR family transcriptional regulator